MPKTWAVDLTHLEMGVLLLILTEMDVVRGSVEESVKAKVRDVLREATEDLKLERGAI